MRKVIIKSTSPRLLDYILIDGENVKFTKDKDKIASYTYEFETSQDEFKLDLDTFHPYLQKNWWIKLTFLKLISFFGLFDSHNHQRYIYRYDGVVKLKEDLTEVRINAGGYMEKALLVEGNVEVSETANSLENDPRIKKRKTGLFFSTLGIVAGIIAIVVLAIALKQ